MEDIQEQKSRLAENLQTWLESLDNQQDIAIYWRRLGEMNQRKILAIVFSILENIRRKRTGLLNNALPGIQIMQLNENDLNSLMLNLSQYQTASVIQNYASRFPQAGLVYKRELTSGEREDLNKCYRSWHYFFYFISFDEVENTVIYTHSIYNLGLEIEDYLELVELEKEIYSDLVVLVSNSNYEQVLLTPKLQEQLSRFLGVMTFLPKSYVEQMIFGKTNRDLFNLLSNLESALVALSSYATTNPAVYAEMQDENNLREVLWDNLAEILEREVLRDGELKRLSILALNDTKNSENDVEVDLAIQLNDLISQVNISSGYALNTLRQYMKKLTPEQEAVFLRALKSAFIESTFVQTIFDPVDIEAFIDKISYENLPESQEQMIREMETRIVPEFWPITKKTMLMMAQLF